jgi:Flp pilus assembly protein TadB
MLNPMTAPRRCVLVGLLALVLLTPSAFAQQEKKLSKKERKQQKKKEQEEQRQAILLLLNNKEWVIEAHTVFDRYNQSYQLNPSINFVGLSSKRAPYSSALTA